MTSVPVVSLLAVLAPAVYVYNSAHAISCPACFLQHHTEIREIRTTSSEKKDDYGCTGLCVAVTGH